jgi:hypothetical protein
VSGSEDQSKPLRPVYWGDRVVTLHAGEFDVDYGAGRGSVAVRGAIRLTLDPAPRVGWTGSTDNHQVAIAMFDGSRSSETWPKVSVPVSAGAMPPIPARRGSRKVVDPPGRISDGGPCDGLTFGADDQEVDRVVFNVINGPDVWFRGRLRDRSRIWLGRCVLEGPSWQVTLDSRPNLHQRVQELTESRRYAFTHVGLLERSDGGTFTPAAGELALQDVFLFLTLVRGATVGVVLPTGFLGSRRAWTRWTSGLSAPYTGHFSWADPNQANDVATLWPRLLAARSDARWSQALFRSIRYYAEALPARSAEVSVIVAQAGLELLATAVLVDRDRRLDEAKWESKPASWRLRKLLQSASIPLAVPAQTAALSEAARLHSWHDIADAIPAMRNTVTHWSTGKPNLDINVWIDVEKVALSSLELSILWALGYTGSSFRRIDGPVMAGASTPVPWAGT